MSSDLTILQLRADYPLAPSWLQNSLENLVTYFKQKARLLEANEASA